MEYRKILPYGKPLDNLLRNGYRPSNDVLVFAGLKAWEKSKSFSISYPERVVCMPPWQSPDEYKWPVAHCSVLIIDTLACDPEYIDLIAMNAFREGATVVRAISQNFHLTFYDKDMS